MTSLNNIEIVSIVTLSDHLVTCTLLYFLHGAKDDFKLIRVEV